MGVGPGFGVVVEVAHVLVENSVGVSFVVDQHPVGALGADAADESFRVAVRLGCAGRDRDHGDGFGTEHGIEGISDLESRSRIRKRNEDAWSPRSLSRVRAAWVVQAAVGCAVTPSRCTLRVRTSITNRT